MLLRKVKPFKERLVAVAPKRKDVLITSHENGCKQLYFNSEKDWYLSLHSTSSGLVGLLEPNGAQYFSKVLPGRMETTQPSS